MKSQKIAVANVGKQLFDKEFDVTQIIGEYLENTTISNLVERAKLLSSINKEIDLSADADKFINHPLAIWLENRIALQVLEDDMKNTNNMEGGSQQDIDKEAAVIKYQDAVLDILAQKGGGSYYYKYTKYKSKYMKKKLKL